MGNDQARSEMMPNQNKYNLIMSIKYFINLYLMIYGYISGYSLNIKYLNIMVRPLAAISTARGLAFPAHL